VLIVKLLLLGWAFRHRNAAAAGWLFDGQRWRKLRSTDALLASPTAGVWRGPHGAIFVRNSHGYWDRWRGPGHRPGGAPVSLPVEVRCRA
jgi:hypothetical protein